MALIDYCSSTNKLSPEGCFATTGHKGQHWGWSFPDGRNNPAVKVYWDTVIEVPEGHSALVLSSAEIGILLTTLQPVSQFFPDLFQKLEAAK